MPHVKTSSSAVSTHRLGLFWIKLIQHWFTKQKTSVLLHLFLLILVHNDEFIALKCIFYDITRWLFCVIAFHVLLQSWFHFTMIVTVILILVGHIIFYFILISCTVPVLLSCFFCSLMLLSSFFIFPLLNAYHLEPFSVPKWMFCLCIIVTAVQLVFNPFSWF